MTLLDYLGFLVGFLEKGTKSANLGNFGVLHHGVGIPRSSVSPHQDVACPRRRAVEREAWTSPGYTRRRPMSQRSTVHRHVFLSCFSILLFRGLVHWTNEDPISVRNCPFLFVR